MLFLYYRLLQKYFLLHFSYISTSIPNIRLILSWLIIIYQNKFAILDADSE